MPKKLMPKLGEDIYKKDQIYLVPKPKSEETIEPDLWGKPVKGIEEDWFYDPHYYEQGQKEPLKLNELDRLWDSRFFQEGDPKKLNLTSNDLFSGFFTGKLELLKDLLIWFKADLRGREKLGEEFIQEMDYQIKLFENSLRDVNPLSGTGLEIHQKKAHIERTLSILKEQRRLHKTRTWRDIVWLKREIVQLLTEYQEMLKMNEMVGYEDG